MTLTRRALAVAERDTLEATRTRIDQAAPRVTFLPVEAGEHQAAWLVPLEPGASFQGPQSQTAEVAMSGWFRAVNDGKSTAIIDVPDGVLHMRERDAIATFANLGVGRPGPKQFPLLPGESTFLFVDLRKTVAGWAEDCDLEWVSDHDRELGPPTTR